MRRVFLSIALSLILLSVSSVVYAVESVGHPPQFDEKEDRFLAPVQGKVNATLVNLRSGPGLRAPIVGRIKDRDAPFRVVGQQDGWYHIEIGRRLVWVCGTYVTLNQDTPDLSGKVQPGSVTQMPVSHKDVRASRSSGRKRILMASNGRAVPSSATGTDAEDTADYGGAGSTDSDEAEESSEMVLESAAESKAFEPGRAYYDFGVFAYEDGDYEDAVSNFKKALSADDENPFYHHFLGKTYQKMDRYEEASPYLNQAWQLSPDMSGLRYDLALQHYKTGDYEKASDLFDESAREDPSNVLASYYAGISNFKLKRYEKALEFLFGAIEKSPSIKVNGFYYAGICYRKMGEIDKAAEHFEFVRDHADSEALMTSAQKWLEEIRAYHIAKRPLSLYAKVGYGYDNNVRLEPLDAEIYADEDDYTAIGYFSGRYNLINTDNLRVGLGYSHYQTVHNRLETYDLIGSVGNLHLRFQASPFTLGFSYFPSHYWLDGKAFMRRHEFRPEVTIKLSDSLSTRLTYSYYDINHVQDNGRDGYTNEYTLDVFNSISGKQILIYGGGGYEAYYPSDPDQDYAQTKAKLGISITLPWGLNLNVAGRYSHKQYENPDLLFNITRRDHKYSGSVSFSRDLIDHWLSIIVEYNYTRNDSNLIVFDYQRQMATLSLATKY